MKFWDSSALLSLMIVDVHSGRANAIMRADEEIVASHLTTVEVSSGLWRRRHAREISVAAHLASDAVFAKLSRYWMTVAITDAVVDEAVSLVSRHALRTGDAVQLGSAIVARRTLRTTLRFVTFDKRLAVAARAEGFSVLA